MSRINTHNCNDCEQQIGLFIDGRLSTVESKSFLSSIHQCPRCTEKLEKEKSYKSFIKTKVTMKECPNRLLSDIRDSIRRDSFR